MRCRGESADRGVKFFFDRNWSPFLARAIGALSEPDGDTVRHLDELFDRETADVDWITALGRAGGWSIITKDRLRKSPAEREALDRTGMVTFIFVGQWSRAGRWEQAWGLVRWWPRIQSVARNVDSAAWEVPYRFSRSDKLRPVRRR
jgi:hypothetical protein